MVQKELTKREKPASASEVRGEKSGFFLLSLEKIPISLLLAGQEYGLWL